MSEGAQPTHSGKATVKPVPDKRIEVCGSSTPPGTSSSAPSPSRR